MEVMTTEIVMTALNKPEIIAALIERDGYVCTYPDCTVEYSTIPDHKWSVTIDHIYPQAKGREDGWTPEKINGLANLQLMHKACNAKKSDLTYNEDGTLPVRGRVKVTKAQRPDNCDYCFNGRALLPGEICPVCESEPMPKLHPRSLQTDPKSCDHSTYLCWMCNVMDPSLRVPAAERIVNGP